MFVVSWNDSVDDNLIKEKGIIPFSNYDDMKKYMDECVWELRLSDLETSNDYEKQYLSTLIKERFTLNKKVGFVQIENSYIEKAMAEEDDDMRYFRENLYRAFKITYDLARYYMYKSCSTDIKDITVLTTLEV